MDYTAFWLDFKEINELLYYCISNNSDQKLLNYGLNIFNKLIIRYNIDCSINLNKKKGFRNFKFYDKRKNQFNIYITKKNNKIQSIKDTTDRSVSIESSIESIYNCFNETFKDDKKIKDKWDVIKYTPHNLITSFDIDLQDIKKIFIKDFKFVPVITNEKLSLIVFINDRNNICQTLLREKKGIKHTQIYEYTYYINDLIRILIGDFLYYNYIDQIECHPDLIYDEIKKFKLFDLYKILMDKLNLNCLINKCNICGLSSYNVFLEKKNEKYFCKY